MQEALRSRLRALAGESALLAVEGLAAGYGRTEIVHDLDLYVAAGQALCLIGPNGAGKSTVLNAIFGFADVRRGSVRVGGEDVTHYAADEKLERARIAYVLQESSVFQDLPVEENLRLGAYLMRSAREAREAVGQIFDAYPLLAQRRREPARVLSGGERRVLEIARALMMRPRVLLVDEPSLGLDPRSIELVFDELAALKHREGLAIVLVEQNAKRGLAFADVGCVMVAGEIVMAGAGSELAADPAVGRLYLGST